MPLDRAVLGNLAAEQMEALEEAYGDDENAQIAGAITIVHIVKQDGDQASTHVRMRRNFGDPYHAVGLMQQAAHQILASDEV
jgi:hypothetical protein